MELPEGLARSHRSWIVAVNGNDLRGYAQVVGEHVVWLAPGGEAVDGRAAFRRWLAPFFARYDYDFSVDDVRIRIAGRWAIEQGAFQVRMAPRAGGDVMEHRGRFVALWRQHDDRAWRIDRYMDVTPADDSGR